MERKNIPDGTGMLFIFDRDQILSFWMKNTPWTTTLRQAQGPRIQAQEPRTRNNDKIEVKCYNASVADYEKIIQILKNHDAFKGEIKENEPLAPNQQAEQ